MAELVNVTIDGTQYEVEKGIPVLLAAERAGVRIPHLCYYEGTSVFAGCRVCVVQIDGARGMPTSCTTPTADGQVIWTRTPEVLEMQRGVMALVMADHPDRCLTCHRQKHCGINDVCLRDAVVTYRCLTCAKNKRCELQSATEELEMFKFPMKYYQEEHAWYGPKHEEMPIRRDNPFIELDFNECILCARCVRTCDEVRGLGCYEMAYKGPLARIDTSFGLPLQAVGCDACGACIDACPVNTIMDKPSKWAGPSQKTVTTTCPHCGDGCQLDVETKREKILRVIPNKAGPANHGFASARGRYGLGYINRADRLTQPLVKRDGGFVSVSWDEALDLVASKLRGVPFGAVASPKGTNEENYTLRRFTEALGGKVGHYARIDESAMIGPLREALGYGAMTNSFDDFANAKCLLVFASDTAVTHPIAAWQARQVARFNGGTLIVADPRQNEMTDWAQQWLRYRPGTETALAAGLLKAVDGPGDLSVEECAAICGVDAEAIRDAARAFAAGPSTVVFDAGITQYNPDPASAVAALVNLCIATGNIGKAGAGIACLRGASNQQGTEDVGCGAGWPSDVRALVMVDVDPVSDDPARRSFAEALERMQFSVALSHFMTATAELADVVLPLASFAEQDGTFTSTERRVQRVNKIFDAPGGCMPGWMVLRDLAAKMGQSFDWPDVTAVFSSMASQVPMYAGISDGEQWGGEILQHGEGYPRLLPFSVPPAVSGEVLLASGRELMAYHKEVLTGQGDATTRPYEEALRVNPSDAARYGVADGGMARVVTSEGTLTVAAQVTAEVPEGAVYLTVPLLEETSPVQGLGIVDAMPAAAVVGARIEGAS
jgi:formate dehydrogenase (NADP+) alpha subunit